MIIQIFFNKFKTISLIAKEKKKNLEKFYQNTY